jgi:hypothetical protein
MSCISTSVVYKLHSENCPVLIAIDPNFTKVIYEENKWKKSVERRSRRELKQVR